MNFQGKHVLVTGAAANSGFAIARRFAAAGAQVAINDIDPDATARAAAEISEATGADVLALPADLTKREGIAGMFRQVRDKWGRLDILVNNAVQHAIGHSFADMPFEVMENVVRVNLMGTFLCGQEAARLMIAQGGGAIVNLGSNTAQRAIRNRSIYCATKGAIEALTRAMALELGGHNIRVNTVVPGYIRTNRWDHITPETAAQRRAIVPIGWESTGDDIADSVLFLASEQARRITGSRLVIDGGCSVQLVPQALET
ncbi:NAD(P)-dependent dehydrogenase (short-subunit alcohol dehydrogenase family) [Ereboglobus sp. PH5-5]|uniref:SDR family NAD(P)-dependent oxidoreductase n=1 Tax=unclassified Ereboglobus TaxID=2626932 RepID=UPI002404FCDF|nr:MULTISPECIES: SDR family oxidoreductase [unclassified Ereboglobus]MDF9827552.1 NAD(P)-dependent dehydrogenase (short-subunit alcohol dehydrogenase family) [Ereboglobus sp. PH5-10]MDF9833142.1 NAD(P)-dependent dehydrogenase (short-subunit alcohol dehydrogenase family) [Ereboglobus sp. PH5-5]